MTYERIVLNILQGAALALSATIMPGPFQAYLLSRSLQNGWRRTLPAAFAPMITDGPIIALVLLILTRFPVRFVDVLQIAGGLFMLYIAGGIFRSLGEAERVVEVSDAAARKSFFQAVAMNALNPNPYIFWSVVGAPIILAGWRESAGMAIGFVAGFFGTFVISLAALIIVFSAAGNLYPNLNKTLRVIAAVALVGFGLYHAGVGISTGIVRIHS